MIRATLRDPKRLALGVYIACFSIGATTHAVDFLTRGFRPYAGVPFVFEAFWTSLILLDLAVVVFLITGRLRAGLALGAAVMIADVVVNFHAMTRLDMSGFEAPLLLQTLFLGFILGSIGFLWPRR